MSEWKQAASGVGGELAREVHRRWSLSIRPSTSVLLCERVSEEEEEEVHHCYLNHLLLLLRFLPGHIRHLQTASSLDLLPAGEKGIRQFKLWNSKRFGSRSNLKTVFPFCVR